jgi:hypothetical protein
MTFGHRAGKAPVSSSISAPTTVGTLADWTVDQNSGNQLYDAASGFAGSGLTFTLPVGATGLSIDGGSGVITADTATTALQTGTALTVRASNGSGNADQALSFTVAFVTRRRPVMRQYIAVQRAATW